MLGENEISMKDSMIGLEEAKKETFYDLSFDYNYFKNPIKDPTWGYPSSYYAIYILENETSIKEKREVANFFGVFSEIGGLIEILMVSLAILVGFNEDFNFK